MLRTYREVLSLPGARAFSTAGALARLPISMVGIGIVLMVSDIYGSYGLAGRVSAVYVIVHAVCSPVLARLVDRHGQARVMRPAIGVTVLGLSGLIAVAQVEGPPLLLYAAAAVAGTSVGSVGALVRARWSHLLTGPREIHTAYSLESALDEVVFIIGPVLATVLATAVWPTAGLLVPMLAVVVGGLWFFSQRATEPPPVVREPGVRHRHVLRSGSMVVVAVAFAAVGGFFGALDVATVAFAEEQGSTWAAGPLLGLFGVSSLLAGLGYGARQWLSPIWWRFVIGMVALALAASLLLLVTSYLTLAAALFLTGFTIAPSMINGNGLVQQVVRRGQLVEGLTWAGTAMGLGVSFGASTAGTMVDRVGSPGGYLVVALSAVAGAVATVVCVPVLRRDTAQPTVVPKASPSA